MCFTLYQNNPLKSSWWIAWLPEWLKRIIMINPLTYGVDALRAVTIGLWDFSLAFDIGLMIAFSVFLTIAAALLLFVKEI